MAKEHNPVYLYQLPSGKEVFVDASGMVHTTNPNRPFDWESNQKEFDNRPYENGYKGPNKERINSDWETVETSIPESEKCL